MSVEDDDVLGAELLRLEVALATRDHDAVDGPLGELIADDFIEFGASGARWDARTVRPILDAEPRAANLLLTDFELHRLADDLVLVTYRIGPPRPTNRSSIWVRRDGRWLMRFHQGTPRPG